MRSFSHDSPCIFSILHLCKILLLKITPEPELKILLLLFSFHSESEAIHLPDVSHSPLPEEFRLKFAPCGTEIRSPENQIKLIWFYLDSDFVDPPHTAFLILAVCKAGKSWRPIKYPAASLIASISSFSG